MEEESYGGLAARNAAKLGTEVLSRIATAPINLAQGALDLTNLGVDLISNKNPLPRQIPLSGEWLEEKVINPAADYLSGQKNYLADRGVLETGAHTFVRTVADLLTGNFAAKGLGTAAKVAGKLGIGAKTADILGKGANVAHALRMPLGKAAKVAAYGNAAKWSTKLAGAPDWLSSLTEGATMIGASAGGTEEFRMHAKDIYQNLNKVVESMGDTAKINVDYAGIKPALNKMKATLEKGDPGLPEKQFLKNRIKAIEDKYNKPKGQQPSTKGDEAWDKFMQRHFEGAEGGNVHPESKPITMDIGDVWELKKDMNKWIQHYENQGMYKSGHKSGEYNNAKILSNLLDDAIKTPENQKKFPDFVNPLIKADSIIEGIEKRGKVSRYLEKTIGKEYLFSPATMIAFHFFPVGTPIATAASYAGRNAWLFSEAMANSPHIRQYYWNTVRGALKENAAYTIKNIRKFDHAMRKEYSGNWRFEDESENKKNNWKFVD